MKQTPFKPITKIEAYVSGTSTCFEFTGGSLSRSGFDVFCVMMDNKLYACGDQLTIGGLMMDDNPQSLLPMLIPNDPIKIIQFTILARRFGFSQIAQGR